MRIVQIATASVIPAPWNPNSMDAAMTTKLRASLQRYGLVQPLVVRQAGDNRYEALSGNQRLKVLREEGHLSVPCVIVTVDDADARLLAQALNRIQGADDITSKADMLKEVLATLGEDEVLSVIPETSESLRSLSSLGRMDMASHLEAWQKAREARLKHMQVQLTAAQLEVVEEALELMLPQARKEKTDSPNLRGTALYLLSKAYLELSGVTA